MTSIEKMKMHEELCTELHHIYQQKNAAYGDSFGKTYSQLGIVSAVTRISDKYNRLVSLAMNNGIDTGDESMIDTLKDMANYCLMTVIEINGGSQD